MQTEKPIIYLLNYYLMFMKNLFKVSAVLAVAVLTLAGCNCFKKMAKHQDEVKLTCTPEVLVLNNGTVEADITVEFPEKYFNAKAVAKVTPVIVFEGGEVAGTTQYFQGSKVDDNYTVIEKKEGGKYTMHVSFPYDERMACSELQLRAEIKCPKGDCKEFTLVNLNTGAIPTEEEAAILAAGDTAEALALKKAFGLTIAQGVNTLQNDINYASAMKDMATGYKNVTTEVTKASYMYAINSSRLAKKAKSSDELTAFQEKAAAQKDNDRIKQNIYVNGYASPDGPEKFNDKLSAARSESGKKAAEELLAEMGLALDAASYGEDWEGFKELVAASDIEDKELILSVLNSYDSSSEREEQIKNMSQVFGDLKKEILPQLRRAQLVNSSDITGKTDDEMVALVRAGKFDELNVLEKLHVATTGKLSQQEKIAVLEAATAEGGAVAYNNLGVAYAEAGEGAKAAQAFAKAVKAGANASEINNNLALVNLMNGDTEAAKAYTANASKEAKALAAAAEGNYAQAQSELEGYNAAIAATMNADYTAAKQFIANDATAEADYLRAVIATKQGDMATATAELKSAIAKDASYAERCKKDVNLRQYIGNEIQL
jgi:outer membrane protein OmpA-like peptidoglycan-associated protein